MTYSTDKSIAANLVTVDADRVFEVIALNKRGVKPDTLESENGTRAPERREFEDVVGQDSLTRFDKAKKNKKKKSNNGGGNNNNNRRQQSGGNNKSGNNQGSNKQSRQGKSGNDKNGKGDKPASNVGEKVAKQEKPNKQE